MGSNPATDNFWFFLHFHTTLRTTGSYIIPDVYRMFHRMTQNPVIRSGPVGTVPDVTVPDLVTLLPSVLRPLGSVILRYHVGSGARSECGMTSARAS